jgi:H+-transporting ATPase
MDAKVVTIGGDTFFGKTARLVQVKSPKSHFQAAVERIGNYLIIFAIAMVSIVLIVAFLRSESFLSTLQFALILVVAAIPAALPAVMTVTLAVGAVALAKKEAIVSRLTAIEEMAGMDILCADKTGTITQNSISVGDIRTFPGVSEQDVIIAAARASKRESNDPIDTAIFSRYDRITPRPDNAGDEILDFVPFDPVAKFSKATIRDPSGTTFGVAKGAPQAIANLTGNDGVPASALDEWVTGFAEKGFRALGVAKSDNTGKWQYLGLIGLFDPPRDDSAATITEAKKLGVNVKMVTGDHIAIAHEVSGQVGLGQNILLRTALIAGEGEEARKQLENADGFAQVLPEDKFNIVKILQGGDHIIGMTGDGVNDAPALREADTGIAVAGATDAAKSAADIVLTKPGLSVIIDAIQRSREIFRRMENYAVYRIAETVRVLIFLTLCIVLLNFYPITALMLVVLAILNDLPIMMIAYDRAIIAPKPVRWHMHRILLISSLLGIIGVVSSFFLLWVAREVYHLPPGVVQTLVFLKLAVAGHLTIYLARTGEFHFWEPPLPTGSFFWVTESTKVVATLMTVYGIFMAPIGWTLSLIIWGYAIVAFIVTDLIKVRMFRFYKPY